MSTPTTLPRLADRVALVTGAGRGIGAAIAARLAADGALVAVNYARNQAAAEAVVARIVAAGGSAWAIQADLGETAALAPMVECCVSRHGRLDILVNNAGVIALAPPEAVTEAEFDTLFAVNVKAPLLLCQAAARAFGDKGGSIINIGSLNSRVPGPGVSVYSATKAALDALTVALSRAWGPRGIRVNGVAPGQTETDMLASVVPPEVLRANVERIALGRLGRPDDIAEVVAFLASDEARWITGEVLHVNGGQRF
jgi:3-oxoacyl-[acyl-carrier protein] reductase